MSKTKDMQRALRYYREQTGIDDVNMEDVARFAHEKLGMPLPLPTSPIEKMAREFSRAARAETRYDKATGRPYRVNHMFTNDTGQRLWLDIDGEAPRHKMDLSLTLRRNQIVDDAYHLDADQEHWNTIHPEEEPIQKSFDFTEDVAERKAQDEPGQNEDDEAAE